jgi:hypothetical protein
MPRRTSTPTAEPRPTGEVTITIPVHYHPRSYQLPFLQAMQSGCKHGLQAWHRRSGKERTDLAFTAGEMWKRKGSYVHLFPDRRRARKILWDGLNREGRKFLDDFPAVLVKRRLEAEMMIELINGSIWYLEGAENIDAVVGANPVGIVYSEYSQMKSTVRALINPILDENGGWEVVNFTPRGKNHAYELYQMALHNPAWYASLLTINDTRRDAFGEDGSRVMTLEMIENRRREGMREPLIQQEYYVSFEAGSALQFIPGEYVQAAFDREPMPWAWSPKIIGVDVGRSRDRSVIILRQGGAILEKIIIHPYQATENPTEHVCGWLSRMCQVHQPSCVFVDGVGIGVGVIDRMRTLGYQVASVLGNAQSPDPAYYNLRAYMWGMMREWLRTEGQLQRGRDDVLGAELQWPQWRWKKDQEWLTPKDELEEVATGGDVDEEENLEYVSPDEADALGLTFAAPVTMNARVINTQQAPVVDWDVFTGEPVYQRRRAPW